MTLPYPYGLGAHAACRQFMTPPPPPPKLLRIALVALSGSQNVVTLDPSTYIPVVVTQQQEGRQPLSMTGHRLSRGTAAGYVETKGSVGRSLP